MTLQGLRERVWRLLGVNLDVDGNLFPALWTAAQANRAINDAYREIARVSGALEMRQIVAMVAGTHTYTLDAASGPVLRAAYDDYPIKAFDPTEFDRTDDYWRSQTGEVTMYHVARLSPQRVRVYPIPDTSGDAFTMSGQLGEISDTDATDTFGSELGVVSDMTVDGAAAVFDGELGIVSRIQSTANNLEVWTKRIPPLLDLDTDTPELPAYSHIGIAFAAASRLLAMRGEGQHPGKAMLYSEMADEAVKFLTSVVVQRTMEKAHIFGTHGSGSRSGRARRTPWTGQDDYAPIPYT